MGQLTYTALMAAAVVYNLYQLIVDWFTNRLLFWAGIFILIITIAGSCLQLLDEEDFNIKWMLWYLVPVALLAVGTIVNYQNMSAYGLKLAHIKPAPPLIPGHASDYASAAWSQIYMMVYPFCAKLIANLAEVLCTWARSNHSSSRRTR